MATKLMVVSAFLATMVTPTSANFDQSICCMLKAREEIALFKNTPWSVCGTDEAYVYTSPGPYQSVNTTMKWCERNCGGYQLSSADEWLRPLTTWVLPTVALLLLCSVGESEREEDPNEEKSNNLTDKIPFWKSLPTTWWKKWKRLCSPKSWIEFCTQDPVSGFRYQFQEYIALLGDPSSAICGGFSEIVTDARILTLRPSHWFDQGMIWVATLAGSTKFDDQLLRKKLFAFALRNMTIPKKDLDKDPKDSADISIDAAHDNEKRRFSDQSLYTIKEMLLYNDKFKLRLKSGIWVIMKARLDFINAVFLPVVLMLATTVSSFHDAYDETGDRETAHNLSYGIWYSWVIILAVVSNSYAASVNPGVAQAAIGDFIGLSAPTLPLRKRFPNAMLWEEWTRRFCGGGEEDAHGSGNLFYTKYIMTQLLGWACVAFACACASAISFTTPTTGIGCDTFTYVLYGGLSFVVALLLIFRHWITSHVEKQLERESLSARTWRAFADLLKVTYAILVSLNAFVFFGSTLFHLIGLYRSCRCMQLFGGSSAILELNSYTQQALNNAKTFWLPVGYVAFSFVWIVCMVAIVIRAYLSYQFNRSSGLFSNRPDSLSGPVLERGTGANKH